MPHGKVRFFDEEKGFGFIHGDDGTDVYVHASVLPAGETLQQGARVEFGVAEGRRGPQALSVRVLEAPRLAKRHRKPAEEMQLIVEDLLKLLDGVGAGLSRGYYPERKQGRQLAALLRKVADEFDA